MTTPYLRSSPIAGQLRSKVAKLAGLKNEAELDVLAYMTFTREHRTILPPQMKLASIVCAGLVDWRRTAIGEQFGGPSREDATVRTR